MTESVVRLFSAISVKKHRSTCFLENHICGPQIGVLFRRRTERVPAYEIISRISGSFGPLRLFFARTPTFFLAPFFGRRMYGCFGMPYLHGPTHQPTFAHAFARAVPSKKLQLQVIKKHTCIKLSRLLCCNIRVFWYQVGPPLLVLS